jgi:hypothetical protein
MEELNGEDKKKEEPSTNLNSNVTKKTKDEIIKKLLRQATEQQKILTKSYFNASLKKTCSTTVGNNDDYD